MSSWSDCSALFPLLSGRLWPNPLRNVADSKKHDEPVGRVTHRFPYATAGVRLPKFIHVLLQDCPSWPTFYHVYLHFTAHFPRSVPVLDVTYRGLPTSTCILSHLCIEFFFHQRCLAIECLLRTGPLLSIVRLLRVLCD